jgi:tetratricopeptide (TPR) repeat protein
VTTVGPFTVQHRLGHGGMAQVFAAVHGASGAPVALKVIDADASAFHNAQALFEREVQAVASLDHPGVVNVMDSGVVTAGEAAPDMGIAAGAPWLAMERLHGSLGERGGRESWDTVRRWLHELLLALDHAHARGVLHRDVKPGNLLLDAEGRLRLCDFGLARLGSPAGVTSRSRQSGTPLYMAPETFDDGLLGPWSDLYAVGCVAHELLTGAPPFEGNNVFALIQAHVVQPPPRLPTTLAVPPGTQEWLDRLLAKAPADRFRRASDAARALNEPTGRTIPPPPPAPLVHDPGRERIRSGLGLVGVGKLPFTGRHREREALWSTLRAAITESSPQAVVLTGVAGAGRTRLAGWLAAAAYEHGAVTASSSGREPDPIAGLARDALHLPMRPGPELAGRLSPHLGGDPDPTWLAEAVTGLLGLDEAVELRSDGQRADVILRLLRALGPDRPLVLVLDDVAHSAPLLRFADHVLQEASDLALPLVLVMASRQGEGDPESRALLNALRMRSEVATLSLAPMSPPDHRHLIGRLLDLAPDLAAELEARTAGRPWFAAEIVAEYARRGAFVPGPRGHRLRPGVTLPQDLHAFWESRAHGALDGAPESDAVALELLAVGGFDADDPIWLAACAAEGCSPSSELVPRLLRARLVSAVGGVQRLAEVSLAESLVLRARRRGRLESLHSACADAHAGSPAPVGPRALPWARHLLSARRAAEAIPLLGAQVGAMHDLGDAAALWELEGLMARALDDVGVARTDSRRAELLTVSLAKHFHDENHAAVGSRGEQILALCAGRIDPRYPPLGPTLPWSGDPDRFWAIRAEGLRAVADHLRALGRFDEARARLVEARALYVAAQEPAGIVSVDWARGVVARYAGDLPGALQAFSESLAGAEAAGEPRLRWRAAEAVAECQIALGRPDEAEIVLVDGLARATEGPLEPMRAGMLVTLGGLRLVQQRYEEARAIYEEARAIHRRRGERAREAIAVNNVAECLRHEGRLDDAARVYGQSADLFARTNSVWAFLPHINLVVLHARSGAWDEGAAALQRVLPEIERHGWPEHRPLVQALSLVIRAGQERWEEAAAFWGELRDGLPDLAPDPDLAWALGEARRLFVASGRSLD